MWDLFYVYFFRDSKSSSVLEECRDLGCELPVWLVQFWKRAGILSVKIDLSVFVVILGCYKVDLVIIVTLSANPIVVVWCVLLFL